MTMKLNKLDYTNLAAIAAGIIGLILAFVGCLVLSVQHDIGMNFNISPVAYVGVCLVIASFVCSIVGNRLYIRNESTMNRLLASLALYVGVFSLILVLVLIPYTIFIPVLNPQNG